MGALRSEAHCIFEPGTIRALGNFGLVRVMLVLASPWGLMVMDGGCQDEYFRCADPRIGRERVNCDFRWIRNLVPQCP